MRKRPLTPELEATFGQLLRAGKEQEVIEGLHREAGLSYHQAKEWINRSRFLALYKPELPCPFCGKALRTNRARQCFECGSDWHDSGTAPIP